MLMWIALGSITQPYSRMPRRSPGKGELVPLNVCSESWQSRGVPPVPSRARLYRQGGRSAHSAPEKAWRQA
jgi:hypothetical protein